MVKGKGKARKPKETEHITIGFSDGIRRQMLLENINRGVGKATEKNGNIVVRFGTESYGYIIYTILGGKLAR